jgi:hypothetical protein
MKAKSIVTGIVALFFLGTILPATVNISDPVTTSGSYTIVKGRIYDNDRHSNWDCLSFGVIAPRESRFRVSSIEITDLSGKVVAVIDDFYKFRDDGTSWYFVSLRNRNIPAQFLTRIHITSGRGWGVTLLRDIQGDGSPTDPDETVVVVKWP